MNRFVWSFVIVVALADTVFTWICRTSALDWEANPAAGAVMSWQGAPGAVAYRLAWLAFAARMSRTKTRLSWLVTPVWGLGHLYLLVILCQAMPYMFIIAG
jgi:hypothetical protein